MVGRLSNGRRGLPALPYVAAAVPAQATLQGRHASSAGIRKKPVLHDAQRSPVYPGAQLHWNGTLPV
jgi:hypothetical protein